MNAPVRHKNGSVKGVRNGGRAPRTRNKATQAQIDWVEATGETPLQFMIRVMRDPAEDMSIRLSAAKDAAPYVHQKLAQKVEVKGNVNLLSMSDDDIERRLLELIGEAGGLRFIEGTVAEEETAPLVRALP
jgi:hypothetical protein